MTIKVLMKISEITSLQNPKIKEAVKLRDRSTRDKTGLFLIEGYRELLRAVDSGHHIEAIYFSPELFLGSNEQTLLSKAEGNGVLLYSCKESVFRKISYRDRPDGLIGIAKQQHRNLCDFNAYLEKKPLFVVAEAIEKPGNLGTILRSADGVGANGLIVCDRCTDIFNPNVVRASVGTLFTVPVVETSSEETIKWLKDNNIAVVAATPHAQKEYTDVDLSGAIAIAVGTEQVGLSKLWMDQADIQVRIPMNGIADSLNVATATTILLYEALRQRGKK